MIYHTALKNKEELKTTEEIDSYTNNGNYVFFNDITKNIPYFKDVDAIYSEPSWQKGYSIFAERANVDCGNFTDYLKSIDLLIKKYNLPTFLVLGKSMLKVLSPPLYTKEIKLNKNNTILGIWNHIDIDASTNLDAINYITSKFNKIYDFSCGCGNLAYGAVQKNKNFVCSDINKKCIFYIAKNIMEM